MNNYQVTLGAAATAVSKIDKRVKQVTIQNNTAHACRVGDANNVTASVGLLLAAGNPSANPPVPGGSVTLGPFTDYEINLADVYLFGTAADVIDVIIP